MALLSYLLMVAPNMFPVHLLKWVPPKMQYAGLRLTCKAHVAPVLTQHEFGATQATGASVLWVVENTMPRSLGPSEMGSHELGSRIHVSQPSWSRSNMILESSLIHSLYTPYSIYCKVAVKKYQYISRSV